MRDKFVFGIGVAIIAVTVLLLAQNAPRVFHPENTLRMPSYLSQNPVLYKVFDIRPTEDGHFRARELSTFFNLVDVYLLLALKHLGKITFVSPVHYIGVFLIALMQLIFSRRFLKHLPALHSLLLILLFVTSPAAALSGSHFRTAKILCTFFIFITAWLLVIAKKQGGPSKSPLQTASLIALTGLAAALSDEIGIVYLFIALIVYALILGKKKIFCAPLAGLLAAIALYAVYRYGLERLIIRIITGFNEPDLYNPLLAHDSFEKIRIQVMNGSLLFGDFLGFFYGGLTGVGGGLVFALFFLSSLSLVYWMGGKKIPVFQKFVQSLRKIFGNDALRLVFPMLVFFYLITVLNIALVLEHPPLLWSDVKPVYYLLPTTGLILLFSSLFLDGFLQRLSTRQFLSVRVFRPFLDFLLVSLLVGNLWMLPVYQKAFRNGHLKAHYAAYPEFLSCLKGKSYDRNLLPSGLEEFCRFYKPL